MNKKVEKALEVLKAGGYFKYALEKGWHGGEVFKWHLYNANHHIVKGYGHAAAHALMHLMVREPGAAFAEYWKLA